MIKRLLILAVCSMLLLGCKRTAEHDDSTVTTDRFRNIKETIIADIDKGKIPSVTVAVVEDGNIIWMESFGYADKENRIKATPDTLYGIASISKAMTATGIMKLVEAGKIDLDADVETYLPDIDLKYHVSGSKPVSCRNLLSHTAGLPMHFQYYYDDDNIAIPEIPQVVKRYGIIVSPPSSKYEYANLGYGILGEVIARTTGGKFNDYMAEAVFVPLGMTQTTFDTSSDTKAKLAKRYDLNGELMPFSFSDTPGAGNASTTIGDLIQFGQFHLGNGSDKAASLLRPETIHSMQQGQYQDNTNGRNTYGLGWFHEDATCKYKMVYHAGGMDGIDAMMRLLPEKDIVVAALSNQYSEYTHELTEQILLEMVPDLKSVDTGQTKGQPARTKEKSTEIRQEDLNGTWSGHIWADNGKIPITLIFQKDGDIHVHMPIQFESLLLFTNRYKIQHKMLLNKWFFRNGHFMGWYAGDIPGEHLFRCPQTTLLNLKYEDGKLIGTATALASNPSKMYYALSHYVELEKSDG